MKTTKRFDKAVSVLYKAFNENTLNAYNCSACAVGNMVGHGDWVMHDSDLRIVHSQLYNPPKHKDYSEKELLTIEYTFLKVHNEFITSKFITPITSIYSLNKVIVSKNKHFQFKGLMAVIEYLAELDGIEVPQVTIDKFEEVLI